ncbi:MAG: uncharacterized protein KVP18_003925 [Porospora cf. gigantea A]|uniref:uncharacterized protein n=1 Tax=Porospora cf. gigantea A TaxID=2853593 RepID=UPI00355A8103|nr:MAG: hypothetical protein KVP18_003925 [Porospora cf. gigantea A]
MVPEGCFDALGRPMEYSRDVESFAFNRIAPLSVLASMSAPCLTIRVKSKVTSQVDVYSYDVNRNEVQRL